MTGGTPSKGVQAVRAHMSSASYFGYLPTYIGNGEKERHGLPSFRYQVRGKREVILISFKDLAKFISFEDACKKSSKDLFSTITDTLGRMSEDTCKEFVAGDVNIYRGELGEGSLLRVPMGYILLMRPIGEAMVCGIRITGLDDSNADEFFEMINLYIKCGNTDNNLVLFLRSYAEMILEAGGARCAKSRKAINVFLNKEDSVAAPYFTMPPSPKLRIQIGRYVFPCWICCNNAVFCLGTISRA